MIYDALVLAVVVFSVCAWGGNEAWAIALSGICLFALLAARAFQWLWRVDLKDISVPVLTPLVLFLVYVFLQWQFWSVAPRSTGLYFILAFSCVIVVFIGAHGSGSRASVRRLVIALLILGAFEAAYGLMQYLGGYEYVWNYRRISGLGVATGTLINRNHYALLMNMCIATGIGYLYYRTERLLRGDRLAFRDFVQLPGSGNLLWILIWIMIMGLALFFSMSRMGIAALFGSVACMALAAKAASSPGRIKVIALVLVFGIIGLAVYAGVDELIARYEAVSEQWQSDRDRPALWRDAWPLVEQRPVLGSGLGTFQWIYPSYESVQPDTPARYAHNDYLQALSEVGIIGFCLMVWAYGASWTIAYRHFKNSLDPLVRGIGLGTMGALGAIALQEITDFGLYIPGVSMTAALLVGLNLRCRNLEGLPEKSR